MTNNINRIGINTNSVNLYQKQQQKNADVKPEEQGTKAEQNAAPNPQVKANDVLSYMAQQAIVTKPQVTAAKTYDIQKYVTPEQAARIAGLMESFEAKVTEGLLQIENEPGLAGLSEAAKYEIAANMV